MTSVLLAMAAMLLVGVPVTRAVDRSARRGLLLGLAGLYGSGVVFLVMLALATIGVRWSALSVAALLLLVAATALLTARYASRRTTAPHVPPASHTQATATAPHRFAYAIDALVALSLVAYVLYATLAPPWEWDFWAIWGLKGRVFFEAGSIDWRHLESPWNRFSHPDYPLLLPLNYAFTALVGGAWNDRWLGLLFAGYAAATLLVVRGLARRECSPLAASAITLAVAFAALSRQVGMAEAPLIAFGGGGVLFLRAALAGGDVGAMRHAALLLGLAACTKNEGLSLLVAVALALGVTQPRFLPRLWPALALATPWLVLRALHALPTDLAQGPLLARLAAHADALGPIVSALGTHLPRPWFWLAVLLALALARAHLRREAFVLTVTALQATFFLGAFLVTPHDVLWHIATSWQRLAQQLALPLTFATLMLLTRVLDRRGDAHAALSTELPDGVRTA